MRQLRLNTRRNARAALARLIRDFDRDSDGDINRFRAMVYALSTLLAFDREIEADELEERLQALEDRLQALVSRPA